MKVVGNCHKYIFFSVLKIFYEKYLIANLFLISVIKKDIKMIVNICLQNLNILKVFILNMTILYKFHQ